MMIETQIIAPLATLIIWSLVIWVWMYATRIPAIIATKMKMDPTAPRGEQMSTLPASVRWKADNFNHLMEQPTLFYAVVIALAIIGEGSGLNLYLAWCYVLLRIIHSLVQVLVNIIGLRFCVFALSNIPLFWLSINLVVAVAR